MAVQDSKEFKFALREIALKAPNLESPYGNYILYLCVTNSISKLMN